MQRNVKRNFVSIFEDFPDTDSEATEGKILDDITEDAAVWVDAKEAYECQEPDEGNESNENDFNDLFIKLC